MRHGTLTRYINGPCRCEPCRAAHSRWQKRWRYDRHRNGPVLVDSTRAREHVEALIGGGMSKRAITLAAGWKSRNSLRTVMTGPKITRQTEARVLAIGADTRPNRYVSLIGSRRRLHALMALGWPYRELAERIGLRSETVLDISTGKTMSVRAQTADTIRRAYDDLWDQPGPSTRTRSWAKRNGYALPLAWDDDSIDDPEAQPHTDKERPLTAVERCIEDYHDTWAHHGGDIQQAADRLSMDRNHLDKVLSRARAAGIELRQPLGRSA